MAEPMLPIEVVYATAEQQLLLALEVPAGTSVSEAVRLSGIAGQLPGVSIGDCPMGIFGKVVASQHPVEAGDRIELYRPLLIDPKEVRKQRAAKVARVFKKAKRCETPRMKKPGMIRAFYCLRLAYCGEVSSGSGTGTGMTSMVSTSRWMVSSSEPGLAGASCLAGVSPSAGLTVVPAAPPRIS